VRLWRTDSTLYVTLRQPGHLLLMHVDAIGRIDVLFPLVPDDGPGMPGDTTLAFDLSPIAEGNPATFVAVRSRWPFSFSVLRTGSDWDYDALLLQPTAGDPLAAMLDIADRVTDGRPYDYGVAPIQEGSLWRGMVISPTSAWVVSVAAGRSPLLRLRWPQIRGLLEHLAHEFILRRVERQRFHHGRAACTGASSRSAGSSDYVLLYAVLPDRDQPRA
jgi:hypothetical protein